jgi:hypothetical protein
MVKPNAFIVEADKEVVVIDTTLSGENLGSADRN